MLDSSVAIGRIIRQKRKDLGLTLLECSALCGIGINTLSRLENGNPNSTLGALFCVLHNLEITLVHDTGDMVDAGPWA